METAGAALPRPSPAGSWQGHIEIAGTGSDTVQPAPLTRCSIGHGLKQRNLENGLGVEIRPFLP